MFLVTIISLLTTLLVFILFKVAYIMLTNHRAQQFFQERAPHLITLKNPNIFSGHMSKILWAPMSYKWIDAKFKAIGAKTIGGYFCEKPAIATIDLDLIKKMILDGHKIHIDRIVTNFGVQELEVGNILSAAGDQWRRLRRAVAPAFSSYRVKAQNVQDEINSVIDNYLTSIENKLSKAAIETGQASIVDDVEDAALRFTSDLVFTCFYRRTNMIDYYAERDFWVDRQLKGANELDHPIVKISAMFPFTRPLISWILGNFHDFNRMIRVFLGFIREQTKSYLKAQQEIEEARDDGQSSLNVDNFELKDGSKFKRNMMDYVIEEFRQGKLMPDEFKNTSLFLFFAANKTSSDAIAKLILHLTLHPEIQEKLRESIIKDGPKSEYLNWCISESLRLYPPVLFGCSRTLAEPIETYDSGMIPAGVFVLTATYSIHRSEQYWGKDAQEFRPERWANANGQLHPCQYFPFGMGNRICPGKEFALQAIKMLMNRMLRKFKFERTAETAEEVLFKAPYFIYNIAIDPTYIKISLIQDVLG